MIYVEPACDFDCFVPFLHLFEMKVGEPVLQNIKFLIQGAKKFWFMESDGTVTTSITTAFVGLGRQGFCMLSESCF